MNFKKFIGVVSALAIASSMAVVANANYSNVNGVQTWDFADSSDAAYGVFAVVDTNENGYVNIGSSITYGRYLGEAEAKANNYATFTSNVTGSATVTIQNHSGTNSRATRFIVQDAEGKALTSVYTVNYTDTAEVTFDVTADSTYKLIGWNTNTNNNTSLSVNSVVVTDSSYVPAFTEPTTLDLTNTGLFTANGVTLAADGVSFDRNNTTSETNVTFTAPQTGTIEVTFADAGKTAGRYAKGNVYDVAKEKNTQTATMGLSAVAEASVTVDVVEGNTYLLYGTKYGNNACASKLVSVVFTPAGYVAPAVEVSSEVAEAAAFTGDDYEGSAVAGVVNVTVANGSADVTATYNGTTKAVTTITDATVAVGVIINGVADTAEIANVVFE